MRATLFEAADAAGAGIVQVRISWRDVAGAHPPANPSDPGDPSYDFTTFDAPISEAAARGLAVLVTVSSAPNWAEGENRPVSAMAGTWKPDPHAFGQFAAAVAKRYSGSYVADAAQGPLPGVRYFEAWNEPNVDEFLAPQWQGGKPFAPGQYRKLLNSFYAGVHGANPQAEVAGPGTAPFGDSSHSGSRMRPLLFLRELFCLRGRRAPARKCSRAAKLDIVSHHPINVVGGPRLRPDNPDDLLVSNIGSLRKTVRAAERAGTLLPRGRRPLWVSEIWWLTHPPSPNGFSLRFQAEFLEQALYRLWKAGVQSVIWYQITDAGGFPTGLYFADGRPKPSLTAFRFPFVTAPVAHGQRAWAIPPESGRLAIQRQSGSGWRTIRTLRAVRDRPVQTTVRVPPRTTLRASVGDSTSLAFRTQRG